MNKKSKALVILVIIAAVFSAFAFLVPFEKGATFWIAYIAELIAIALQIPIFKVAFDSADSLKSKVLGFPVFRIGYMYLGIQTAVSIVLFILGYIDSFPVWLAALICIVILAGAIVFSIQTDIARTEVEKIEATQKVDTSFMTDLRTRSAQLVNIAKDAQIKKQLETLAENIRFSDPVSSPAIAADENKLRSVFTQLEAAVSGNSADIAELCSKVQIALNNRNTACKMNKS